ncbi:MAG: BglG family transcription antiterminator [Dictyoglomus sp.]
MDIKKRHLYFLYYLLEQNYPVPLSSISKELGYSTNTLKKDLATLEGLLAQNNIKLIRKPKVGIFISGNSKDIEKFKYIVRQNIIAAQDKTERFYITAFSFLLLENPPTIERLSELLETSPVSAINYIKKLKEYLKPKKINIIGVSRRGYKIIGEETDIREEIFKIILEYYSNDYMRLWKDMTKDDSLLHPFININFNKLIKIIENYEEEKRINFEDIDFIKITLKIAIALRRIKIGKIATNLENFKPEHEEQNLIKNLETELKLAIPNSEYYSILKSLLDYTKVVNENIDKVQILNILKKFILIEDSNFYYVEMLINHIQRGINKVKTKVKIENPLLDSVKEVYKEEFEKAMKIIKEINKKFKVKLSEEEAGFITLYLNIIKETIVKRKRVIIVCPMGIATSNMLYWTLKKEFPNIEIVSVLSYREFLKKYPNVEADLIISTFPLSITSIPYIIVSPLLTKKEKELLRKIIGV